MIKSRTEAQGGRRGEGLLGPPRPAPVRPRRAFGGGSEGRRVWGMGGARGAGGPRCQAALAVLASLCRARPPPPGLDVETCRSFELQPPERSPSAADAGTAKPEARSLPGGSPWLPPIRSPRLRSREHRNLEENSAQDCGFATSRDQGPGPWPAGRMGRREGDPEERSPLSPAGDPAESQAPGCGGPRGSVSLASPLSPCGPSARKGAARRAGDQGRPGRGNRSSPRGRGGPRARLPVRLFSRGTRPELPGLSGTNLGLRLARGLCVRRLSGCEWLPAPPARGGGGRGEGVAAPAPAPAPGTRSLGRSDSLGLAAGARLSRCLSPTSPSGRLLPERRGPCAAPGGRRAQAGARTESSSPEPVSPRPGAQLRRLRGVATAATVCRAQAGGAAGGWAASGRRPRCPPAGRSRAATLASGSPASLSGSRRPEGPGREGAPGRLSSAAGRGVQREASRECGVGAGRSCGDRGTGLSADSTVGPDPDPGGAGPRGLRRGPGGFVRQARERGGGEGAAKGGSFVSTRFSGTRTPRLERRRCRERVQVVQALPGPCFRARLKVRGTRRSWVRKRASGNGGERTAAASLGGATRV